jgi:hypothetical protein
MTPQGIFKREFHCQKYGQLLMDVKELSQTRVSAELAESDRTAGQKAMQNIDELAKQV